MKNLIEAYIKLYNEEDKEERKEKLIKELSERISVKKEVREVTLPELWKSLKIKTNIKQKEIAEQIGTSQQTVSNMLNKEEVTFTTFKSIVEAFGEEITIETNEGIIYKIK